jgi:predicted nucleic acid-binding protein
MAGRVRINVGQSKAWALGIFLSERRWDVRTLPQAWSTALPEWAALDRMEVLKTPYQLSFWDSLPIATCLEAGIDRLFSEDCGSYSRIDALEFVNPFKEWPDRQRVTVTITFSYVNSEPSLATARST